MIDSDEIYLLGLRKDKNNEQSDLMRIEKLETKSDVRLQASLQLKAISHSFTS